MASITSLGTCAAGVERTLVFKAVHTLVNSGSLILLGAANITTASGDTSIFRSLGSGNWRQITYSVGAVAPYSGTSSLTLTGDVTGSGTGTVATTIAPGVVAYSKIQNVSATKRVLGRNTAGAGVVEEVSFAQMLGWAGATDGQVPIGKTSDGSLNLAVLTAGSNVSITNAAGAITIASSNPGGTVTSVALTMPSVFGVSGSPVTGSGTLAVTLATETANTFFAGPTSGGAATPTFRAIVAADLPAGTGTVTSVGLAMTGAAFITISGSPVTTSGTLTGTWTGTLGDTLYASATDTWSKLAGNTTAGKQYLSQTGTGTVSAAPAWGGIAAADVPVFIASGASHAVGIVPDPGSSAGTTHFLREDATWAVPPNSGGTVTSVGLSLPAIFTVSGSPVTGSGTLTAVLANESANLVFAGPTTGAATAPTFRALVTADLPAGTGTVTSVALTMPAIFAVSGSPITGSGTLAVTLATEAANVVLAGPPSGGVATPAFRALVAADIPAGATPGGTAGGDLAGSYPNPTVSKSSTAFALTGSISATIGATVNNWNPTGLAGASRILVTNGNAGTTSTITGLAGGSDGRIIVIEYIDTATNSYIKLAGNSGSSTAANQFAMGYANYFLGPGNCAILHYNGTSGWIIIGGSGVGNITLLNGLNTYDSATATVLKGSIVVGNSTPAWDALPVGTDTYVLTADSAQTKGVKWAAPAAGGSGTVTSITAGTGLTGGTITASGTIALSSPVAIANGGTNATTASAGLDNLTVQSADIASAATTDLSTATGRNVNITGTTTITALGTCAAGIERVLKFAGALTFTYNATSLILPGSASIKTVAGDTATMLSLGSGNWRCTNYQTATGTPVVASSGVRASCYCTIAAGVVTVVYSNGITSVVRTSSGNYTITFNFSFGGTGASATFAWIAQSTNSSGITVTEVSRTASTLLIRTSSAADINFSLIVTGN